MQRIYSAANLLLAVALVVTTGIGDAFGQGSPDRYPSQLIRIIVPFAAGGTADALARIVGDNLSERWGSPVIVENKPGAQGNIGMALVAKSPPDGYTLALVPVGNAAVNPSLFKDLPYDPVKDFAHRRKRAGCERKLDHQHTGAIDRARQVEDHQYHLFNTRRRQPSPPRSRTAGARDRHPADACAISGLGTRFDRRA